jgi:dienelactone hydrolase
VDWLAARPVIDPKRVYRQGYSHGAVTAIGAIDAQWPRKRFPAVAGVVAFTPHCLQRIRFTVPTLVLAAEHDDWSPARLCAEVEDRRNLQMHIYPGAYHGFAVPARDTVFQGHRLKHDPEAAADALQRALSFIQGVR